MTQADILSQLWQYSPLSWAIIRTSEVKLLAELHFKPPILEVGCGDGLVTSLVFRDKKVSVDLGIELDKDELKRAQKTKIYKELMHDDITKSQLTSNSFNTIFSNGVYEHIPNIDQALSQTSSLLRVGGRFITTFPSSNYTRLLFYYRLFSYLKLNRVARCYGNFVNRKFAHYNLYSKYKWQKKMLENNLKVVESYEYNNEFITALHDLSLPFAIGSKYIKNYTDKMALLPNLRIFWVNPLAKMVTKYIVNQKSNKNASMLLIAEKI